MPLILITIGGHADLHFDRNLRSHIARMTLPNEVTLPQVASMGEKIVHPFVDGSPRGRGTNSEGREMAS